MIELIKKEIRENMIFMIIGFTLNIYLIISIVNSELSFMPYFYFTRSIPILDYNFLNYFSIISFSFAAIIGFNQTIAEEVRGTYLFLLSKPLKRRTIFFIKALTALIMYFIISLIPALVMIYLSAKLKYFYAPFRLYMCYNILLLCFFGVIAYLGAFYTGVNSGRWFGTKGIGIFFTVIIFTGIHELPDIKRIIILMLAAFLILLFAALQTFSAKEI